MTIRFSIFCYILNLLTIICCTKGAAQMVFEFDNSVEVVENDKKLALPWAGGLNSGQYQSIDLDRDGKLDLVIFDRTSIKINTFIWTDDGYVYDPDYEAIFPDDLNAWLVIVDFNCDGIEDMVSSSVFGMKAYLGSLKNNVLEWDLILDPIVTEGFSSQVNLQVNSADVPAIVDVDDDGDLDIFVFNFARGGTIEFHQNLSMENEGKCGLVFKRVNSIWGNFEECTCGVYGLGISCSEMNGRTVAVPERILHAGGKSLLLFDYDGDNDIDMLFGDEECDNLAYFENDEVAGNADFNNYLQQFPEINPAEILFPAAYLVDTDHDGLEDLVIAPNLSDNSRGLTDFSKSSSLYKNIGSAEQFKFQLIQGNFLQDEMIDWGDNAVVALHDLDKDGKTDLIIGNGGSKVEGAKKASLVYYKNTGSINSPEFTLQSADYLNLSTSGLVNISPGFADLNGDKATDLYFKGISPDGNTALFYVLSQSGEFSENPTVQVASIALAAGDNPVVNFVNEDAFADLLIFRGSGRVDFYTNKALGVEVEFNLERENFAGFTDKFENRNLTPAIFDVDANGRSELIVSNAKGQLFIIEDFSNHQSALENARVLSIRSNETDTIYHKSFGFESNVAFGPLFSGELPSMIVGSKQGGAYLLRNKGGSVNPDGEFFTLTCSPIPTDGILNVEVSEAATIMLYNTLGKLVWEVQEQSGGVYQYQTAELAAGIYILKAVNRSGKSKARKIIVI